MASSGEEKSYWPHMILGFLGIGIMLGYWTIKSAASMPVSESNNFQKKYQQADMNINKILEAQELFNANYLIVPMDFKESDFKPKSNMKRKQGIVAALGKKNKFSYKVTTKDGEPVNDANVSFLLTRPHTVIDDQKFKQLKVENGIYSTPIIRLNKAGRYILSLRVQKNNAIGYLEYEGYLKPE